MLVTPQGLGALTEDMVAHVVTFKTPLDPVAFTELNSTTLFFLSPSTKTIFSITTNTQGAPAIITPWSEGDAALTTSKDIAIAKFVFVLTQQGTLLKFSKGRKIGELTLKDPLGETQIPLRIEAMREKLIALDTHRGMLLEINPQGVVERQFKHASLTHASEIVIQNDRTVF